MATQAFESIPRPIIDDRPIGFAKLIVDRERHTIVGCHVVGERAVELAQLAAAAIAAQVTVEQLALVPFSFPTYAKRTPARRNQGGPRARPSRFKPCQPTSARPGWNKGLYAHMRRVLESELGQKLYRRRMATVEPVFGQNKSRAWIYEAARTGRIPSVRIGGQGGPLRFVPEDVERWLDEARRKWKPGQLGSTAPSPANTRKHA